MSYRCGALWTVVALAWVLPPAVLATPAVGPPGKPEPGSAVERLHRHLERLDHEVGRHWRRVQSAAGRGELPTEASAHHRITGDAEGLRRRLDLLNVKVEGLPDEESRHLRSKVRSIGRVLGNLERVAAGQNPPPFETFHGSSVRGRQGSQRLGPQSLAAATTAADSCADAPLITSGTFSGTTLGAASDGTASCGSSNLSPDVWFRWVAPTSATISMDTFGSAFDTVLSVNTTCPPSGFDQACNDDTVGLQSAVSFFASAGTTYWIRISGFSGASGPFEFHLGSGGAVSGTVTRASDGGPVGTGQVEARSTRGFFFRQGDLQADGTYTIPALSPAGEVQVRTATTGNLLNEVWDDHPCQGPTTCDILLGETIPVNSVETVPGIDFALDVGGAIAGQVTHGATGDPVEGVEVQVWSSTGIRLATSVTGPDGMYTAEGLAGGGYRVLARSSAFADQLYDGIPCPGFCQISDGAPVEVTLGATTSGIDFSLDRLGIIEGTVTEAATGDPIEGAFVRVLSSGGSSVGSALADASGSFQVGGLPQGSYFLTASATGFVGEVYQETLCPFPCDEQTGTPVEVMVDQVVSGIDFTLEGPGSISGAFTAAGTGDPVVGFARVRVFDPDGRQVGDVSTLEATYRVDDLPAGQYFVRAEGFSEFLDQLYDGVTCLPGCPLETGTPVTVVADTETTGIDFALDRGGVITGRLTDALTGAPLADGLVTLYSELGTLLRNDHADENGVYRAAGLLPGSYLVESFAQGYSSQLYDGVPCFGGIFGRGGCRPEDGDPVTVDIGVTATGIDFAKEPLARLSGRVFRAATGQAVSSGDVNVFDSSGQFLDDDFLNFDGTWSVGVPAGQYFLLSSTFDEVIDEIWDGHECFPGCDPTEGTPLTVEAGEAVSGLDFSLELPGSISGTVVNAATGEPLPSVHIEVFGTLDPFFTPSASTDLAGRYVVHGLFSDTYFVRAEKSGFLTEFYDDLVCTGGCDRFKGQGNSVQVVAPADTPHIDFALEPFTSGLVGSVVDGTTRLPVIGVGVRIWDSTGALIRRVVTRTGGVWLAGLDAGTYLVSTDTEGAYVDQVHPGVVCPDGCDPLSGTPVTVGIGDIVRGIDFSLEPGPAIFTDSFESGDLSLWMGIVP